MCARACKIWASGTCPVPSKPCMLPFRTKGCEGLFSICSQGQHTSCPEVPHQQSAWIRFAGALPLRETHFMPFLCLTEKVQAEIEWILGPSCLPTFEDRKKKPFTNAVIHEVQRFVTLLPHVPQCTSADTHFKGYFIPKVLAALQLKRGVQDTSDPQRNCHEEQGSLKHKAFGGEEAVP